MIFKIIIDSKDHYLDICKQAITYGYKVSKADFVPEAVVINKGKATVSNLKKNKYWHPGGFYLSYYPQAKVVASVPVRKSKRVKNRSIYISMGLDQILGLKTSLQWSA